MATFTDKEISSTDKEISSTDNEISSIDDMIRAGIESDKSIYILINEVLSVHANEKLCEFQRVSGENPKRLWIGAKYTDEIANKYNHFTGKLISVCELLNETTCDIENVKKVSGDIAKAHKIAKADEIANGKEDVSDLFDKLESLDIIKRNEKNTNCP